MTAAAVGGRRRVRARVHGTVQGVGFRPYVYRLAGELGLAGFVLNDVHGVLVVPALHRLYATASGENRMVTLDEDTGTVLHRSPTGDLPDGLAYDPVRHTVWTTNETGGSETVIDATTGAVRGTVPLGGEAGNVAYDPATRQMLVDVQTRDELAVIDSGSLAVTRRVPLPGCDHDHVVPFDHEDPQAGGPSCECNLAPLCRHHHQLKTHAGWTYTVLDRGLFLWTDPFGHHYLRDHHGTTDAAFDQPTVMNLPSEHP